MTEYIERGAAVKAAKHAWGKGLEPTQYIEIIPAADVVPVVRCKDCKFWDFGDCYRLELSRPDDFCSYGEMRDNNG